MLFRATFARASHTFTKPVERVCTSSHFLPDFIMLYNVDYLCNNSPVYSRNIGAHLMTMCCFLTGIAMSLFGPADFWMNWFGWEKPHKWLVIMVFAVYGFLMGGVIMPTFGEMLIAAK